MVFAAALSRANVVTAAMLVVPAQALPANMSAAKHKVRATNAIRLNLILLLQVELETILDDLPR